MKQSSLVAAKIEIDDKSKGQRNLKEENKETREKTVIIEKRNSALSVTILYEIIKNNALEEKKNLKVEVSSHNCIAKDLIRQVNFNSKFLT